jgi:hypothetical protein
VLNLRAGDLRFGVEQVDFQSGGDGPVDPRRRAGWHGGRWFALQTTCSTRISRSGQATNTGFGFRPLFVNAAAETSSRPNPRSPLTARIDTMSENEFESIRNSIRLTVSILAPRPRRDRPAARGRPHGRYARRQGANVFKDRVRSTGPTSSVPELLVNPQDNDARQLDSDPSVSVVQLHSGIMADFAIQIVDGFESLIVPGVGVDDRTLRTNVTIDENGIPLQVKGRRHHLPGWRIPERGIDYVPFDSTSNDSSHAAGGIWPDSRSRHQNQQSGPVRHRCARGSVDDGKAFDHQRCRTAVFEVRFGLQPAGGQYRRPESGTSTVRDRDLLTRQQRCPNRGLQFDNDGSVAAQNTVIVDRR